MAEADLVQVNAAVDPSIAELVNALSRKYGWSRRTTIATAIRTLAHVMSQHEYTAGHAPDKDIGDLFLRLAREAPAGLVDLKDSVKLARLDTGRPAVLADGWTITSANDGELVGLQPSDGGFRMATIADGAIRVKATWTEEEAQAALAPAGVIS
jgi:hypothetical protein